MLRKKGGFIAYMCVFILGLCMLCGSTVLASEAAENEQTRGRVLFISSYSYAWETVPEQIAGIQESLAEDVDIDYKFMDTKNLNTDESKELFYESMKEFLRVVPSYDVIIAGDDDAFNFVVAYQQELFHNTPIVFEGVNNVDNATVAVEQGNITGVVETLSYKNTIALALSLYPKASNVVAILDDTVTGKAERKAYYEMVAFFPTLRFQEINASECSKKELIQEVTRLDENSLLLFIMCTEDREGNIYNSSEAIQMLSQAAPIPVFSIVSNGMGYGVLGGEVISQKEMGYEAAEMSKKILAGAKPESISMKKNPPKSYCFDAIQMKRFGIAQKRLPQNTTIVNRQETFLTRNGKVVRIVFWVVVILGALLGIMVFDNIRRRKLNGALEKIKETLEEASRYDVMTGLFNRRVFMEEAEKKIKNQETFGVLLMDLDNFKNINDSLGHNNGDVVLKELASRLKTLNDENFSAYRLAGDEFTAIIDSNNPDVSEAYAKEIQFSFLKPYVLENEKYYMHSSIGLSMYPRDGETVSQLVASADAAMYKVKNNGKGGIAFYDKSCDEVVYERKRNGNI